MKKPYQFSPRVQKILIALSYTMISVDDDLVISNRDKEFLDKCVTFVREFPKLVRLGFILGLYLFDRDLTGSSKR